MATVSATERPPARPWGWVPFDALRQVLNVMSEFRCSGGERQSDQNLSRLELVRRCNLALQRIQIMRQFSTYPTESL